MHTLFVRPPTHKYQLAGKPVHSHTRGEKKKAQHIKQNGLGSGEDGVGE